MPDRFSLFSDIGGFVLAVHLLQTVVEAGWTSGVYLALPSVTSPNASCEPPTSTSISTRNMNRPEEISKYTAIADYGY